jgi:hypothetical protein
LIVCCCNNINEEQLKEITLEEFNTELRQCGTCECEVERLKTIYEAQDMKKMTDEEKLEYLSGRKLHAENVLRRPFLAMLLQHEIDLLEGKMNETAKTKD